MDQATIMDTPQWRAFIAEQHEQQQRSWRRAVSRHAKMIDLVAGLPNDGNESRRHISRQRCQDELPFYPLHCAASQGMVDAGQMILAGCSGWNQQQTPPREGFLGINVPDVALGCTPLHWAAIANRVDFVQLLLDHGARVDSRDHAGRTPLFSCCAFGAVDAAVLLLERNADGNAEDSRGLTPLHAAAAGGHLQVAEELLAAGADVTRRASVGCMPRHVAERQGHVSMVELLATAGQQARRWEGADDDGHQDGDRTDHPVNWLISQLRASLVRDSSLAIQ
ncbi:unnamed protein product [Scytosiphon promiscuus]